MGLKKCDVCGEPATHAAHEAAEIFDPLPGIEIGTHRYLGCEKHSVKAGRFWYDLKWVLSTINGSKTWD